MTPVTRLLRDLIALPSVNPAFLPEGHPHAGEAAVADFLAATAATAGLDIDKTEVAPGRSNLIVRLTPRGRIRHRVLLAPHLDTVGAAGQTPDPRLFQPRIHNGRIHGRGACDTKGSVAAMLTALIDVARRASRPSSTEIVFAGLIDEESGQIGSRHFARTGGRFDLGIVGEPTRLQVVTAHKGDLWLKLETLGRAAHGSTPHLGINAIHSMALAVRALEETYTRQLRKRRHPVLGQPTVNVGTIQGGTQPNVVPAQCRIEIDRRTLPGETERAVRKEILTLLKREGVTARMLNVRSGPCPALETPPNLPLVADFLHLAGQQGSLGVDFFCDAAILAARGTPCVVFGPGDIAQAHTQDEWMDLQSLEDGRNLLTRFLGSL